MATTTINAVLDAVINDAQPKSELQAHPVEVVVGKSLHAVKALRAASRLARLMTAPRTAEIDQAVKDHQQILFDLGFRSPATLKECNELLARLGGTE